MKAYLGCGRQASNSVSLISADFFLEEHFTRHSVVKLSPTPHLTWLFPPPNLMLDIQCITCSWIY